MKQKNKPHRTLNITTLGFFSLLGSGIGIGMGVVIFFISRKPHVIITTSINMATMLIAAYFIYRGGRSR